MISPANLRSSVKAWLKEAKFKYKMKKGDLVYKFKKKCNIHCGSTRAVVVTKRYAFKFPRLNTLDQFFRGLGANQKERLHWKEAPEFFVPVLFSIPGLLVVMPALKPFGDNNPMVRAFMADLWHRDNDNSNNGNGAWIARRYCEYINENYAMYKGKPMCIDYGTYVRADVNEQDFQKEMEWLKETLAENLGTLSSDDKIEEVVQSEQKPYQICLELLDIPVFTATVEDKGSSLAHDLDDKETPAVEQVVGGTGSNHCQGHHGLGDYPVTIRGISTKGCTLPPQKETFAPTLVTTYPGNTTLRRNPSTI